MLRRFALRAACAALALALAALLAGCGGREQAPRDGGAYVLLDGERWAGGSFEPEDAGALRVYVALDGEVLIDLPFAQAHTVSVVQSDGSENVIALTGEAVYMQRANCENQDCVDMGEVTPDNLEMRVLGGFIVCLPHRLSVEVRGA